LFFRMSLVLEVCLSNIFDHGNPVNILIKFIPWRDLSVKKPTQQTASQSELRGQSYGRPSEPCASCPASGFQSEQHPTLKNHLNFISLSFMVKCISLESPLS